MFGAPDGPKARDSEARPNGRGGNEARDIRGLKVRDTHDCDSNRIHPQRSLNWRRYVDGLSPFSGGLDGRQNGTDGLHPVVIVIWYGAGITGANRLDEDSVVSRPGVELVGSNVLSIDLIGPDLPTFPVDIGPSSHESEAEERHDPPPGGPYVLSLQRHEQKMHGSSIAESEIDRVRKGLFMTLRL